MSPTSYQGPAAADAEEDRTYSQTVSSSLGDGSGQSTVADILSDKGVTVYAVSPDDPVRLAVSRLRDYRVGALVVMEEDQLRGIVSERDVVKNLDTDGAAVLNKPVAQIMTASPFTCVPSDLPLAILHRMTEGRFRHMPVVEDGKLLGLVSIGDVVKIRLRELEYEALRMRQMIVG